MSIRFGNTIFPRNGVLASGILGVTGYSMLKVAEDGAGGVTCKSISKIERKGHPTPVVQVFQSGVINAVGLSSTGVERTMTELRILKDNSDAVVIASIFAGTIEEFGETASLIDENICDMIEVNISCPNVADEFGLPFASDPKISGEITRVAKDNTKLPVIIKLSPNYPNICEVARACEANGADGITAINTLGPGMLIDIHTYKPKLSNKKGGVSGPAIFSIALRIVYDLYKAVHIPIIGMGGITEAEDAIQMITAGATLYGVGTGILYNGTSIFKEINDAVDNYLAEKKMKYEELIGIAHRD